MTNNEQAQKNLSVLQKSDSNIIFKTCYKQPVIEKYLNSYCNPL